jgi:uncharacterized protein YrzB (UPF0473 family)
MMELLEEYRMWCREPKDVTSAWYQQRGYKLEELIKKVMKRDGLQPRASYGTTGEQIDGSFLLGDRVYLLEAKWHKNEMSASDIYAFKGKVDGKLVGTIGIFISISGFSKDTVNALICGKEINIILFNRNDFENCLKADGAFKKILLEKLRAAAEQGTPFYPIEAVENNRTDSKLETFKDKSSKLNEITKGAERTIFCEGETDRIVLEVLAKRITTRKVRIIVANGARNIPLLANSVMEINNDNNVILVADSDGNEKNVYDMLKRNMKYASWKAVVINDSIEDWLDIEKSKARRDWRMYKDIAENIDIEQLQKKSDSFKFFYDYIH